MLVLAVLGVGLYIASVGYLCYFCIPPLKEPEAEQEPLRKAAPQLRSRPPSRDLEWEFPDEEDLANRV